eukprot:2183473-Rhodomonas_salina.1
MAGEQQLTLYSYENNQVTYPICLRPRYNLSGTDSAYELPMPLYEVLYPRCHVSGTHSAYYTITCAVLLERICYMLCPTTATMCAVLTERAWYQFCRLVREVLCEFELPYRLVSTGNGVSLSAPPFFLPFFSSFFSVPSPFFLAHSRPSPHLVFNPYVLTASVRLWVCAACVCVVDSGASRAERADRKDKGTAPPMLLRTRCAVPGTENGYAPTHSAVLTAGVRVQPGAGTGGREPGGERGGLSQHHASHLHALLQQGVTARRTTLRCDNVLGLHSGPSWHVIGHSDCWVSALE